MSEEKTIRISRAITGLAMAKGESHKIREWLMGRKLKLQAEIDEIDKILSQKWEVDSWYDALVKEEQISLGSSVS